MGIANLLRSSLAAEIDTLQPAAESFCDDPAAGHLLRRGAYCKILLDPHGGWSDGAMELARQALKRDMTMVPAGETVISPLRVGDNTVSQSGCRTTTEAFFVDRLAVTNAQFERFVAADGYRQEDFWPEDILPLLLQFVDQTGQPGPLSWRDGRPDNDMRQHPVVGICWYEANAYALWAGKQLLTPDQWQRAGTWWKPSVRYPWGNSFESGRANLAPAGHGRTLPADAYPEGATPNGVQQLVGNVWEWIYASIDHIEEADELIPLNQPLGEIRGGAFDTHLVGQATCAFRSGLPLLQRPLNVGLRCGVSARVIAPAPSTNH